MEWMTATAETPCGKCATRIPVGEPVAVITARAPYTGRFLRCIACAGDAVPAELTRRGATCTPSSMTGFRQSAPQLLDELESTWGAARTPGDEG